MGYMKEALNERKSMQVPTDFIMQFMNIILNNYTFEFYETH